MRVTISNPSAEPAGLVVVRGEDREPVSVPAGGVADFSIEDAHQLEVIEGSPLVVVSARIGKILEMVIAPLPIAAFIVADESGGPDEPPTCPFIAKSTGGPCHLDLGHGEPCGDPEEDALDYAWSEVLGGTRRAADECWRRADLCAAEDVAGRRRWQDQAARWEDRGALARVTWEAEDAEPGSALNVQDELKRASVALGEAMRAVDGLAGATDPYETLVTWLRAGGSGETYSNATRALRLLRDDLATSSAHAPTYAAALRTLEAAAEMLASAFACEGREGTAALARASAGISAVVPRLGGARFASERGKTNEKPAEATPTPALRRPGKPHEAATTGRAPARTGAPRGVGDLPPAQRKPSGPPGRKGEG